MRKSRLNWAVDWLALVAMTSMVLTGLVIRYVLPIGSGGRGRGLGPKMTLWDGGRHDWGDIHFAASIVLGCVLLAHLALHWTWVCATVRRWWSGANPPTGKIALRLRLAGGILSGIAIVALITGTLWMSRRQVVHHDRALIARHPIGSASAAVEMKSPRGAAVDHQLRGSMTLQDAATATGLSVEMVKERLSLPYDTPPDRRLGPVRRELDTTMQDMRRLLQP